jgi:uncharacterized protein (TIGR02246 family)
MAGKTPEDTMRQLIAAFNAGDIEGALSLYDRDATFVFEPGKSASGLPAIRGALDGFLASKPALTIESHETVEAGNVALFCTSWSLRSAGPDGSVATRTGKGAVVLRRQVDGTWVVAVEHPWTDLLR